MVYAQPNICLEDWDTSSPMEFWHTHGSPNFGQTTRPYNKKQKKNTCKIVDFAVPANHRKKLNESEKKDKHQDLARELKKLWKMKVMFILIVISALGTVTKGLIKGLVDLEITGTVKTIQITALLRSVTILRRIQETWGDLLSLKLQGKTISERWWEKLWRGKS